MRCRRVARGNLALRDDFPLRSGTSMPLQFVTTLINVDWDFEDGSDPRTAKLAEVAEVDGVKLVCTMSILNEFNKKMNNFDAADDKWHTCSLRHKKN